MLVGKARKQKRWCRIAILLGQLNKKGKKEKATSVKVEAEDNNLTRGVIFFMRKSITQNVAYRQSMMECAEKYGVSRTCRKHNKSRSYIYFWKKRWDGTPESLARQSKWPIVTRIGILKQN